MNKNIVYKKSVLCIIIILIIVINTIPSNGIFIRDYSKINYNDDLKISIKRIILTSCTHWGGVESDGIAADDIKDWIILVI